VTTSQKRNGSALCALLALTKGESVTAADVHDAWCATSLGDTAVEFYARPFDELSEELKRRDEPFAAAIRAVARDRSQGATTRSLRSPSAT
jgi:hypothetical protein